MTPREYECTCRLRAAPFVCTPAPATYRCDPMLPKLGRELAGWLRKYGLMP